MKNSDLRASSSKAIEPAVIVSALALWGALSPVLEGVRAIVLLVSLAVAHVVFLIAIARVSPVIRTRAELGAATLLPCGVAAFVDRHAHATLEPFGTGLLISACVLHIGLCLDHAMRRRTRLESRASEPTVPLSPPARRASIRGAVLGVTAGVALFSLARAVTLRSDAALASTWGDAATGASILVASVPIVLAVHLTISVLAPRFRRGSPKPGGPSRIAIWSALALIAIAMIALR